MSDGGSYDSWNRWQEDAPSPQGRNGDGWSREELKPSGQEEGRQADQHWSEKWGYSDRSSSWGSDTSWSGSSGKKRSRSRVRDGGSSTRSTRSSKSDLNLSFAWQSGKSWSSGRSSRCCDEEEPPSGWDRDAWDKEWLVDEEELADIGYCDAHCHLDYVVMNERHGLDWTNKTKICIWWEEGNCPYGEGCGYAHGEDDLYLRIPLEVNDVWEFAERHPSEDPEKGSWVPPPPTRPQPRLRALVTNCCEVEAINDTHILLQAADRWLNGKVFVTYGCHPHNFYEYSDAYEAKLLKAMEHRLEKVVGWGECGLDYYKNHYYLPEKRPLMMEVFARQARLAVKLKLPLVVHARDAEEDTLEILQQYVPWYHPVHVHAYQGKTWLMHKVLRDWPNSVFGVSAVVTFAVAGGAIQVAEECPLERLVLETDAPFLAGEPRGVLRIAAKVAQLKGSTAREVLEMANRNCERFYRLEERLDNASNWDSWAR